MPASKKIIALVGNPNVGKSTVFNALTGLHQHTGNWPGKTVASARGSITTQSGTYELVDLPGTYSLLPDSAEEEITRDFLLSGAAHAVIVVCDATCLEHNLILALQTMSCCPKVILCINLMDEAHKKGIHIDAALLRQLLHIPVVTTAARQGEGLPLLLEQLDDLCTHHSRSSQAAPYTFTPCACRQCSCAQGAYASHACAQDAHAAHACAQGAHAAHACAQGASAQGAHNSHACAQDASAQGAHNSHAYAQDAPARWTDIAALAGQAKALCDRAVSYEHADCHRRDRFLDGILTGKYTAYPIMLALLAVIFWITIIGANYPSALLSSLFSSLEERLLYLFQMWSAPPWLTDFIVGGIYRVLSWVVAVMLPPMAIFFPLFTLLEDVGYLPRIAYNLDYHFQKCHACGKQALTMAMGFGCNAVGVVGARIISSPRERLIAILTNSFVPCNGRFPTLITIITLFFLTGTGLGSSLGAALCLSAFLLLSILMTFACSKLLSVTLLKGVPSSFTLELPPYRRPQVGKVIVRSLLDRTLFVLGRAVTVAAPAGAVIWCMANLPVASGSLLSYCASALEPLGRLMGMDGCILMAFLLGLPANEIVIPLLLMTYTAQSGLVEVDNMGLMKTLLLANGWTWRTALCMGLFSLFHWPCATTLLSIRRETKSLRWTLLAFILPTVCGIVLCIGVNAILHFL